MKASAKFRENHNPILKAKIPLNTLGIPFRSSIETSTNYAKDKDLCLSFSTLFQFGPVLKLLYRPNDSDRPFGLVIKTGVGSLGSPFEAPMTMGAEFNFVHNGNPSFFIHFKSQLGDFSIRRSVNTKKIKNDDVQNKNVFKDEKITEEKSRKVTWADLIVAEKVVEGLFGGEVCARTMFPVMGKVAGKIQWSLKFPATQSGFAMGQMPYMVVNKLGIEHVGIKQNSGGSGGDVAEACWALKKELGNLELEKVSLQKEIEELKRESEISAEKFAPVDGSRKVKRLRRIIERLKSKKERRSRVIENNNAVNGNHSHSTN